MARLINSNFIEEDTCFAYGIEADTYEEAKELAYQLYQRDKEQYIAEQMARLAGEMENYRNPLLGLFN